MQNTKGYNLLEIIITLTISIILTTLALPTIIHLWQNHQQRQQAQQLKKLLIFARTLAIQQHQTTIIKALARNSRWQDGVQLQLNNHVLRQLKINPPQKLTWKSNLQQNKHLTFTANGNTKGQHGHFTLTMPDHSNQITIFVGESGRIDLRE